MNDAKVLPYISFDDLTRSVWGRIISNKHLIKEDGLLHQHAFQSLSNILLLVTGSIIAILLLRQVKIGKQGMTEEVGNNRGMMLQFPHEWLNFIGAIFSSIGQLAWMYRNLQGMIQIFFRIIFRSIGEQEKCFDFLIVFFSQAATSLPWWTLKLSRIRNTSCFEARIRRSMKQVNCYWLIMSW